MHSELDNDAKSAMALAPSSTISPTTVFAVDELSSVFRVPDDAVERSSAQTDRQNQVTGCGTLCHGRRSRCLTPSFTTDGEMSTFSEDTESGDDEEAYHVYRRRQSSLSIFRPVGSPPHDMVNKKRQACHDDDDGDANVTPTKRRACCAHPLIRHANPVRGNSDDCDELSPSSHPVCSSPFSTRLCRAESSVISPGADSVALEASPSPYTSLFAEATLRNSHASRADTFSIVPKHLRHPLSVVDGVPGVLPSRTMACGSAFAAAATVSAQEDCQKEN